MTLTTVLFVGGESRRMGADKATLLLNGEPLWSRQLRVLRELQPEEILISARMIPAWASPEMRIVLDATPSRGPLSGLAAALGVMRTTHLLALAVDLPGIEARHLRKLWSQAEPECGVIPETRGLEPLCAIYPAAAAEAAKSALAGDDFSLASLARNLIKRGQMKIFSVTGDDRELFLNANTAADFDAARHIVS